jgi:hypothetical protein
MLKLQDNIVAFADGNTDLFDFFGDYWNHYCDVNGIGKKRTYTKEFDLGYKEQKLNKLLKNTILERANVPYAREDNVVEWFNNPNIKHEVFAVVGALIDAVLPQTIIDSIGMYTEVRTGGFGDSFTFDIEPRDLFVVSKGGRAQRSSQIHRQYRGQVPIIPENHIMTVGTFLYKILAGQESMANLVVKAVRSIETQMTLDAYNAFATAMSTVDNTATTGLRVAGYTQESLVRLCQQVSAWNGGSKPVIVGTQLALVNVLPDDANYRYTLEDDFVQLGYVRTAFGYDVMALPQVADYETEFGLSLSNDYIWILSPSNDKIVKLCLEGSTLSFTDGMWDNANLTQNATFQKAWGVGVATNALAGVVTLS